MNLRVARLLLAVVLFVGWLGFLGYEVYTRPVLPGSQPFQPDAPPLVLSRPQILTSDVDIVAELGEPHPPEGAESSREGGTEVKVLEVLGGQGAAVGETVVIYGLRSCQAPVVRGSPSRADWSGPGQYILPLKKRALGAKPTFEVAGIPPSPTYPVQLWDLKRIYPATTESRAQYRECGK